jgi:anionic cell wall polymer biosynthesis LytR-Cps2A-Psr (LCP) family protein
LETKQIDIGTRQTYGEGDEGPEEDGLDERAELSTPPSGRRFGRPLALFLLLLVSLAAGGIYMSTAVIDHVDNLVAPGQELSLPKPLTRVLPGIEATPADGAPGNKRINILVLGIDKRPHHTVERDGPPNTDSIHLVSIDPVTKTATALTFPRDLYLEMPNPAKPGEFIETRINQAYRLGIEAKYPPSPCASSRRAFGSRSTTMPWSIGSPSPT